VQAEVKHYAEKLRAEKAINLQVRVGVAATICKMFSG
jgi:hypothetical protein